MSFEIGRDANLVGSTTAATEVSGLRLPVSAMSFEIGSDANLVGSPTAATEVSGLRLPVVPCRRPTLRSLPMLPP
ncbi:hypothetical protein C4D60_Mb09t09910 [Musa balbisiana]|uniref:Uncharacterized protein n=1 Tax=Musa balbisiana TaxID=52838 RepID=A0A4S8IFE9_MUSBA|nr:hypothetical protein C4D60_Mb09t09910 [Musa balbisiana]